METQTWAFLLDADSNTFESAGSSNPTEDADLVYDWYSHDDSSKGSTVGIRNTNSGSQPTWRSASSDWNNNPCVEFLSGDLMRATVGTWGTSVTGPFTVVMTFKRNTASAPASNWFVWRNQGTSGEDAAWYLRNSPTNGQETMYGTTTISGGYTWGDTYKHMIIWQYKNNAMYQWVDDEQTQSYTGSTTLASWDVHPELNNTAPSNSTWETSFFGIIDGELSAGDRSNLWVGAQNVWGTFDA
jgi:hypothetical protein